MFSEIKKARLHISDFTSGWTRSHQMKNKYEKVLKKLKFKEVDSASIGDSWTSTSVDKWVNKKAELKVLIEQSGGHYNNCRIEIVPLTERHTYVEWNGKRKTL